MRKIAMFAVAGVVAVTAVIVAGVPAIGQVPQQQVTLTGAREAPGPGDANARGQFTWSLDGRQLCYLLSAKRIRPAAAAHIHRGRRGVAGPVIIELNAPRPASAECLILSAGLAKALRDHPARFYVNVHNVPFPAGALRAQLG
jgi:CHRD domain-containing protein